MLKNVLWFFLSVVSHMGKFVESQRCFHFRFRDFRFLDVHVSKSLGGQPLMRQEEFNVTQ